MNNKETLNIEQAIERAIAVKAAWQPVYVDVLNRGKKIGHIVSDGYLHETWDFYPIPELRKASRLDYARRREQKLTGKSFRREVRGKDLNSIIPKWATPYTLDDAQTYSET